MKYTEQAERQKQVHMSKLLGILSASSASPRDLSWPVPELLTLIECAQHLIHEHPSFIPCFSQHREVNISFSFPLSSNKDSLTH